MARDKTKGFLSQTVSSLKRKDEVFSITDVASKQERRHERLVENV